MEKYTIYLDFDGTVVEHEYPNIGRCNFGSFEVIKKLQDAGHRIILNTTRVEFEDGSLEKALEYINQKSWMFFKDKTNDPELLPIQEYTSSKYQPNRWDWDIMHRTKEIYIDDTAFNIPVKNSVNVKYIMVDWDELDKQFIEQKLYV